MDLVMVQNTTSQVSILITRVGDSKRTRVQMMHLLRRAGPLQTSDFVSVSAVGHVNFDYFCEEAIEPIGEIVSSHLRS